MRSRRYASLQPAAQSGHVQARIVWLTVLSRSAERPPLGIVDQAHAGLMQGIGNLAQGSGHDIAAGLVAGG